MKEDVLEQIVDDYLQHLGYFTQHNIRFRPREDHPDYDSEQDSVRSDVDVVGIDPKLSGRNRVMVVTCKSWQAGFNADSQLTKLRDPDSNAWKHFRELWVPKWSEAFRATIANCTGVESFDYRIAVTRLRGNEEAWERDPTIEANLSGCTVGFLTLEEMWKRLLVDLHTTPAASQIGRLAQVLKAANLDDETLELMRPRRRRRKSRSRGASS